MNKVYLFILGREPELSFAEIKSLWPNAEKFASFVIVNDAEEYIHKNASSLGGTIKIVEILARQVQRAEILKLLTSVAEAHCQEGKKLRIGIDTLIPVLSSVVFKLKDALKKNNHSVRIVQHENGRVKGVTTLHEKLTTAGLEFFIMQDTQGYLIGRTIWIQDIDAYTARDMERERSMVVGMMPPKLAQIMINLGTKGKRNFDIWDPFCGLGTTLIEAAHAGYENLLGSDISGEMVDATTKNLEKSEVKTKKVFRLDATKIDSVSLENRTVIVTEGMLGRNFTPVTLTHTAAIAERGILTKLYKDFFDSASKNDKIASIVVTLPRWHIGREIITLPEISEFAKNWKISPLCIVRNRYLTHARPGQSVSREIVILEK